MTTRRDLLLNSLSLAATTLVMNRAAWASVHPISEQPTNIATRSGLLFVVADESESGQRFLQAGRNAWSGAGLGPTHSVHLTGGPSLEVLSGLLARQDCAGVIGLSDHVTLLLMSEAAREQRSFWLCEAVHRVGSFTAEPDAAGAGEEANWARALGEAYAGIVSGKSFPDKAGVDCEAPAAAGTSIAAWRSFAVVPCRAV